MYVEWECKCRGLLLKDGGYLILRACSLINDDETYHIHYYPDMTGEFGHITKPKEFRVPTESATGVVWLSPEYEINDVLRNIMLLQNDGCKFRKVKELLNIASEE